MRLSLRPQLNCVSPLPSVQSQQSPGCSCSADRPPPRNHLTAAKVLPPRGQHQENFGRGLALPPSKAAPLLPTPSTFNNFPDPAESNLQNHAKTKIQAQPLRQWAMANRSSEWATGHSQTMRRADFPRLGTKNALPGKWDGCSLNACQTPMGLGTSTELPRV